MLYVRMLFSMLVSLYTSRVVLNTLGVEDYGIYNVVGGFVSMFSLISSSLSSASSRFLTFELGKGDMMQLKRVFSTSLLIHIALSVIVFILLETVGVWFLNTRMTIPAERLYAANWVFQASIVSFILGLISVSYNASIVSHERMGVFAFIGIFDVLLRLGIVLFITYSSLHFDRLIVYSLLLVFVSVCLQCVYFEYCRKHFEECRFRLNFNKRTWKEMSSFAGWNFIGCLSSVLKDQGVNILLNIFYGPVLNATRGIAVQVNTAVSSFSGNFIMALNPQITKSFASKERKYTMSLVERGARFSFYVMLFLALPILFETEFILNLWLGHYPFHTINFVRLILLISLFDILSNTLITLQLATGNIRKYQIAVGCVQMMNFPLSYISLKLGFPPETVLFVALGISLLNLLLRLVLLREMVELSMRSYLRNVCANVFMVVLVSSVLPVFLYLNLEQGWMRFLIITIVCPFTVFMSVIFIGCNSSERQFLCGKIIKIAGLYQNTRL